MKFLTPRRKGAKKKPLNLGGFALKRRIAIHDRAQYIFISIQSVL
jgi:hypothetical protein